MVRFAGLPVRWRTIKTRKKDGTITVQEQATVSYTDGDGKTRRKSKLFPADADLNTEGKKKAKARKWLKELDAEEARKESERVAEAERQEAERKRQEAEAERLAKIAADPYHNMTVGEYVSRFVDGLASAGDIERSTAKSYRGAARHIETGFSGVLLYDLTPTMVQGWRDSLLEDYASASVTKWLRVLSEALQDAVNKDVLAKNPCKAVRAPKRKPPEPNSLTAEQYARFAVTLDNLNPSPVAVAAAIAMHCGLRCGEICGIRWREYDREARIIHVREAIGNDGSGKDYSKVPKTLSSVRDVPVPAILATMLERRLNVMLDELEEAGITPTGEELGKLYIVGNALTGKFASPTIIERQFKGLAETFGLAGSRGRRMTMHGLRDSYATLAIGAGADVRSVAGVLGHSNPSITLSTYADALPEGKRRASDLLTAVIAERTRAAQGELEPFATLPEVEA